MLDSSAKSGVSHQHKPMRLVLTGGGTAGHVMPHLAILPVLRAQNWNILYIGSEGLEKQLIRDAGIPFASISTGKLRRYWSWKNLTDILRVVIGILQAVFLIARFRPHVVFSKGGFVSVPVSIAAWLLRVPVVSHESDISPGLANRIIGKFAQLTLYAFPETARFLSKDRSILVGLPIRPELMVGSMEQAFSFSKLDQSSGLPRLLVMGGSQGAQSINEALERGLPGLVQKYQVIHITGKGKKSDFSHRNYFSVEFVNLQMADLLAWADIVVSRAGANSVFEIIAVEKPMVLIPLVKGSGDQLLNAKNLADIGCASLLEEGDLAGDALGRAVETAFGKKMQMLRSQREFKSRFEAAGDIPSILLSIARKESFTLN